MSNSTSILEIRKDKFIENPNQDSYSKLVAKIDKNKEIFNNQFFAKATEKFIMKKEIMGLIFISQLYIFLERNIEAEHILFQAYKIDNTNNEIIYHLFDILCRRKQLGLISTLGEKLVKLDNELMYVKSLIKYFLLTNKPNEINNILKSNFEKYKTDREFVFLIYISAIQNDDYYCTYLVSKTMFKHDLFCDMERSAEHRIKGHFHIMICNLLTEKFHDNKNR